MSINRVGTALVAAVGCLAATDLSQANAAGPGPSESRAMQIKSAGSAIKVERGRLVIKPAAAEARQAGSNQSSALNPMLKKRMQVRR